MVRKNFYGTPKADYMIDMPNSNWRDIGGKRYGRLVAEEPAGEKKNGQHIWWCRCDCGNVVKKPLGSLKDSAGGVRSCGCLVTEAASATRHGLTGSPIHNRWLSMKKRCFYKRAVNYKRYGGAGVTVCERWMTFENFLEDMGHPPSDKHELDRKESTGNYEPGNCQWLDPTTHRQKTAAYRKACKKNTHHPKPSVDIHDA